jgi:hypothetical protein
MREVAGHFGPCGRQRRGGRRLPAVANAFERSEDKHLIADDWPSGGCAELVLDQLRFGGLEETARVQVVVAVELPDGPVNFVGRALLAHADSLA